MEAVREEASWLTPLSDIGAAFQIMQANVQLSIVTGSEDHERRRLEAQMTRLLYRATDHLMRAGNSLPDARQFSMSDGLDPRRAMVVAKSFEQARAAAALIRFKYEAERGTYDLNSGSERTYVPSSAYYGAAESRIGDPDQAFANAAVRVASTYITPHTFAQPLEPQSCVAIWEGQHLKVWASTQVVSAARTCIAVTLNIPEENIWLGSSFVGGGFGAKLRVHEETILAAIAARRLGIPVKVTQTRRQMFALTGHRGEMSHDIRFAADRNGKLVAIGHDVNMQCNQIEQYVEQVAFTIMAANVF